MDANELRRDSLPEYGYCNTDYAEYFRMDDAGHPTVPREQLLAWCEACPARLPCSEQVDAARLGAGERSLGELVVAGEVVHADREGAARQLLASVRAAFRLQKQRPYPRSTRTPYGDTLVALYAQEVVAEFSGRFPGDTTLQERVADIIRTACIHEERAQGPAVGAVYADVARQYVRDVLRLGELRIPKPWIAAFKHGPETFERLQHYRSRPPMTGAVFSRILNANTRYPEERILQFFDDAARLRARFPHEPQFVINAACMAHELNHEYVVWRYNHNLQLLLDAGYGRRRGFTLPQLQHIALTVPTRPLDVAKKQAAYFDQLCIDYANDEDFDEWIISRLAHTRYATIDEVRANAERWRRLYHDYRDRYAHDDDLQEWMIKEAVFLYPRSASRHLAIWKGLARQGVLHVSLNPLEGGSSADAQRGVADPAAYEGESQLLASEAAQHHRAVIARWASALNVQERHALAYTQQLEWLLPDGGAAIDPVALCDYFGVEDTLELWKHVEAHILPKLRQAAIGGTIGT